VNALTNVYTRVTKKLLRDIAAKKGAARGITITDLTILNITKKHAQNALRKAKHSGFLYTRRERTKPQTYYLSEIQADIEQELAKREYNRVSGVASNLYPLDALIDQSLQSYVLPLLPSAPIHIHRLELAFDVNDPSLYAGYYSSLNTPPLPSNGGKTRDCRISGYMVRFTFYPHGKIMVFAQTSNKPHRIMTDDDRSQLNSFLGQIRQELIAILNDPSERIVPPLNNWLWLSMDINKDIPVSHDMHVSGLRIQWKHIDRIFRIYIKSLGNETVCRVEEARSPKLPVTEVIEGLFTVSKVQNRVDQLEQKVSQLQLELQNRVMAN